MGSIGSIFNTATDALFGNSGEESSLSANHAWDLIKNTYLPATNYTTQGGNAIASLLGIGGGGGSGGGGGGGGGGRPGKGGMNASLAGGGGAAGQTGALENWANSGGMNFLREQGNKQITSNQAAKGLLNSGSTLTALTKYGQGLGSTYLNQYMGHLFDFARLGLGAGGLLTSAGQYSKGSKEGPKQGILPMAAGFAGGMA